MGTSTRSGWLAGVGLGGLLVLSAPAAHALPPGLDADQDGFLDLIEVTLGSDPAAAASTPESPAVPPTCLDGADNDADGLVDAAETNCTPPAPSTVTFPGPGRDEFDSGITLEGYPLATPLGVCPVDFDARGPTVVQRGPTQDIGGGLREFAVEIVALQLTGTATIGPMAGCAIPPGDYDVTLFEDPAQTTSGRVTDTNPDSASDFPAASFFDVFFQIDTPLGVLPGGPPNGPAGQPVRVTNTVAGIPPYQGGENPACYEVAGLGHKHCPMAPPDHFKCYSGKFPRFARREVTLEDQFTEPGADLRGQVLKPLYFCNPASKNAEPLYDETKHLECYKLKAEKVDRTVRVQHQFGQESITARKPALLCLPSKKDALPEPVAADHYKCYRGKFPRFEPRPVTLFDQYGTEQTTVRKPRFLCNPVRKNGEPISDPLKHLECYKIDSNPVTGRTAAVTNQFGSKNVRIRASKLLCLPSTKFDGTTTTTTIPDGPTTTTTTIPTTGGGRAVTLAQQTGPLGPGTPVCLDEIQGGCVAQPDACPTIHLHGAIGFVFIPGMTFPDPNPPMCGHGRIMPNDPNCGPDTIPPC